MLVNGIADEIPRRGGQASNGAVTTEWQACPRPSNLWREIFLETLHELCASRLLRQGNARVFLSFNYSFSSVFNAQTR